jgi:hypothetical protein
MVGFIASDQMTIHSGTDGWHTVIQRYHTTVYNSHPDHNIRTVILGVFDEHASKYLLC